MFLGAGLVLSGCGDDDTATTPAPAPPPPPPPAPEPEPEPEPPSAPATPTGFHVDTTQTSLTWHWNAVEGAIGYAVQISTDEMFDDTDTITPTVETSLTIADLPPQTTLYGRVAAAAGTLEAPILSAWTTHVTGTTDMPPPPPPPPMAPATPTGFMVESDMTSITWSWDAVEGALGYAIQVSTDEMFDDMDAIGLTLETSHTVSPLPPGTTLFARVASGTGTPEAIAAAVATGSLEGLLVSAWTTHMTGMTEMPPPPPPPMPDPVSVTFSVPDDADDPHFLVADDDDDEDTAMAKVNTEIMVESDTDAIITPMFVDGANGVSVMAGADNMPFTRVSWELSQSEVLFGDGAQFMVQRAVIGANQEMEPTGDVQYVTCGPFECAYDDMESPAAPELSIADSKMCTDWDPDVSFEIGKIDNDVIDPDSGEDATDGVNTNDGIDLGIVTSSSLEMTLKHVFSGVSEGTNSETKTDADKGSDKILAMKAVAGVITVNADEDDAATAGINEMVVCDNTYEDEDVSSKVDRPGGDDGCFRLIGPGAMGRASTKSGGPNYLAGWSIELSPMGADVSWGDVAWEEDPFEELTCGDADPIMVSDHVDVCEMFETEVSMATGKGWKPSVVFNENNRAVMWSAGATAATGHERMFKTLWFDDNLNGKIKDDAKSAAQADRTTALTASGVTVAPTSNGLHDLYNQNRQEGADANGNITKIWQLLTDADGDLTAGDVGKADLVSSTDDYSTADDERTITVEECASGVSWIKGTTAANSGCGTAGTAATVLDTDARAINPDGRADNYETTTAGTETAASAAYTAANRLAITGADDFLKCSEDDGGDDADGSECDAEWEMDVEILFADGTFGCTTTRDITVTCMWDADGGMAQGRNALPDAFDGNGTDSNLANYLKCSAK